MRTLIEIIDIDLIDKYPLADGLDLVCGMFTELQIIFDL